MTPLRKRGLKVAVDDAGSGFSSMRHILQLQPDIIKLDRTLITGIHTNPGQRALGSAMVKFAQKISATIIAEGNRKRRRTHDRTGARNSCRTRLSPRPPHNPPYRLGNMAPPTCRNLDRPDPALTA